MSPKFDLEEVKQLVEAYLRGENGVWFSARSASIDYVVKVLLCDVGEAESVIVKGLLRLQPDDFHKRVLIVKWDNVVADEYGLENYLGHNWYIKFLVEDDGGEKVLNEVSFHPTEDEMRLADGRTLSVTLDKSNQPARPSYGRRQNKGD